AVRERQVDVRDARSFIAELQLDAGPPVTGLDRFDLGHATAAVHQRVPREFARGRYQLGLVDQRQSVLGRHDPHLLAHADDVVSRLDLHLIHQDFPFSISRPFSALSAVRTPVSGSPSSVSVIATAGRMPTMTVSASNSREIEPIMDSIRPMNESTISTAVMSMITPCAPVAASSSARSSCKRMTVSSSSSIWIETNSVCPIFRIGTCSISEPFSFGGYHLQPSLAQRERKGIGERRLSGDVTELDAERHDRLCDLRPDAGD